MEARSDTQEGKLARPSPWPGKAVARIGLRRVPTSPPPFPAFRNGGSLRRLQGLVGLSGRAFLRSRRLTQHHACASPPSLPLTRGCPAVLVRLGDPGSVFGLFVPCGHAIPSLTRVVHRLHLPSSSPVPFTKSGLARYSLRKYRSCVVSREAGREAKGLRGICEDFRAVRRRHRPAGQETPFWSLRRAKAGGILLVILKNDTPAPDSVAPFSSPGLAGRLRRPTLVDSLSDERRFFESP